MNYNYLNIEDAKKLANYDKLVEENTMLKSNDILNKQKIKELKKQHEKELTEYKNKIKILEERVSSLEYKQVDMFGEV